MARLLRERTRDPLCKCSECGLAGRPYVPSWLPGSRSEWPDLLWIAQAPGTTEALLGRPLCGSAGKMLWRLMTEAGFNRDKNNLANICNCWPVDDREPTPKEAECCNERLKSEIQLLKPKLIIALGKIPLLALTGSRKTISKARGEVFDLLPRFQHPCKVLVTLHPSFVMRQRQWIDVVVKDLKQIYQIVLDTKELEANESLKPNPINPPMDRINLHNISDLPRFNLTPTPSELSDYLSRRNVTTAFDLETTGLNPRKDTILACSFSSGEDAIVIHWDNAHLRPIAQKWLEDPNAKKVTQNGSFDCSFLDHNGTNVHGLAYDTRLAEHLLNSDLPTDLQFLRKQYTDILPYKRIRTKKQFNFGDMVTDEECAWDSYTTLKVMQGQLPKMSEGNHKVLREIYIPLVFTLNKMEKRGIRFDVNRTALMYANIMPMAEELRQKYFAPLGLNPNSPKQMCQHFGVKHTVRFNPKVSRGDPNDYLDYLMRAGHPDTERIQALFDYRKLTKQASTALLGMYKRQEDGFIHTNYHPEGTGTGRISSRGPNLQNVQKEFRAIFIPDDEDHRLIEADYSQLELVVAAILGNEQNLLQQIKSGEKPHHILCSKIFHKKWDDKCTCTACSELTDTVPANEQEKLREKAVLFGVIGGRTSISIAKEFGCSRMQAEAWTHACFNQYPGLLRFTHESLEEYKLKGGITTAFGTFRLCNEVTQAMNNKMQGSASFVTLTSLIELDKIGIDLRLTVHDSIAANCHKTEVLDVAKEMKKVMERPIRELNNWSFKAKYEVGENWYELEEIQL